MIVGVGLLGIAPASAAPGDATASAVDLNLGADVLGAPVIGATAQVFGAVTAPATVGTSSPQVAAVNLQALGLSLTTDAVTVSATRGVNESSASAEVADVDLDLLGIDVITAGAVSSSVTCAAGEDGGATTTLTDVTVLGQDVVSVAANTPTVLVPVAVTIDDPDVASATLSATVTRVEDESADGARGAAVEVELTLNLVLATTELVSVPVGTVVLAESTCQTPAAVAPLTATGITPAEGPQGGGTAVEITGTGFVPGATTVTFDGVPATDIVVAPDGTSLTATTPAGAVGPATVVIDNTLEAVELDYTYLDDGSDAIITGLTPAAGPTAGGTQVTITGSGLTAADGVTFGGTPATDVTVNPAGTQITATVTASETAGPVEVDVQFPAGSVTAGNFTFVAPTITSITPSQGPVAGGTTVEITGTGLEGATQVTFAGLAGTDLTLTPEGTLTVVTPPGSPGLVDVVVTLPGLDANAPDGFFYVAPGLAQIEGLSPASGPTSGGTVVTITGANLGSATAVTFDGAPAEILSTSASQLVVRTPAGDPGPADVVVTNAVGDSLAPGAFEYLQDGAGAVVTSLTPPTVSTAGGTVVTIVGEGFDGATDVLFGDALGTDVTVSEDGTTITVTAPPSQVPGQTPVTIVFPAGQVPAGDVTYVAPTLVSVNPGDGATVGGTRVVLTGTGLGQATAVTFAGVPGTDLVVSQDGTQITVTTPPGTAGLVDVEVALPGADALLTDGFLYRVAPTASTLTPSSGPLLGGQTVLITGTGFVPGQTTVTFDGVPSPTVRVLSPTALVAITPAHDAGQVDVVVSVGSVAAAALAYVYDPEAAPVPAPPVIDTITPASGGTGGGTIVTVTGTGFVPDATSVVMCDVTIPASDVQVNPSGTRATFATPPCTAGTVTFTLVTPGGTADGTFTYTAPGGASSGQGAAGWSLASTGADVATGLALVLMLVLAGAAIIGLGRRRAR